MQAILPVTARTCWRPSSRPGRRPATRLHALPQRPRVSAFAADVAVAEEEAATAPAEVAPADLPPLAIPIIPAAGWLAPETNGAPPPALADALMAAATEYGMFQIVDHGVSLKLLANLRTAQRAFFSLPLAKKMAVHRTVLNPHGYFNADFLQKPLDHLEGFDFGSEALPAEGATSVSVLSAPNQWPEGEVSMLFSSKLHSAAPATLRAAGRFVACSNRLQVFLRLHRQCRAQHPAGPNNRTSCNPMRPCAPYAQEGFRAACEAYFDECTRASFKLLAALSAGLGLAPTALHPLFEGHTSFLRLNHFPTASAKHDGVANHGHTDPGFLTILIQDSAQPHGGLQVHRGGAWQDVEPVPDALLIQLGDLAQVLTNDVLRAPAHRVLSPAKQPRFSAPYHFSPARQAVIEPLPQFTSADRPPVYQPIPWELFRAQRYAGDFQGQRNRGGVHQFKV